MSLTVGSVSVDEDGVRTGSGYALALYDSMVSYIEDRNDETPSVEQKLAIAEYVNAQAGTLLTYVVVNAVVTVPANAFGSGIPAAPVVLNGAIS